MITVTITVNGDRYSSTSRRGDDEAELLANCIYQIAETSPSPRVAALADAVHQAMRPNP